MDYNAAGTWVCSDTYKKIKMQLVKDNKGTSTPLCDGTIEQMETKPSSKRSIAIALRIEQWPMERQAP